MQITRLRLKNWRNFRSVDIPLWLRTYVIGANAAGKSNLLDVFRFLRTLAQTDGGGLQKAVKERGGLGKLRSLHARKDPEVRMEVELADGAGGQWRYALAFKSEGKGRQRLLVSEERVERRDGEGSWRELLARPTNDDKKDPSRLTQTYLEQINNNEKFRELAQAFSETLYLHLVPQLLKQGDSISTHMLEHDPFGQGLMQRIAGTPKRTREARLSRIEKALGQAVPLFSQLRFAQDNVTGLWHLEANFKHWREHSAWQREEQFSDGTLRLIGLLWALQEGDGLLLLEEPELSLNDGIVEYIPLMIERVLRGAKKPGRQVLISTHSEALLGCVEDGATVLRIEPDSNGSEVREPSSEEKQAMAHLTPAEVLLPKTRPQALGQLGLF